MKNTIAGYIENVNTSPVRKSKRIAKKTSFSKFKNTVDEPLIIGDLEDEPIEDDVGIANNSMLLDDSEPVKKGTTKKSIKKEIERLKNKVDSEHAVIRNDLNFMESEKDVEPKKKATTRKAIREEIERWPRIFPAKEWGKRGSDELNQ